MPGFTVSFCTLCAVAHQETGTVREVQSSPALGGGECTNDHACHSHQTIDLSHPYKAGTEYEPCFSRTRLTLDHRARSAVVYLARRMEVELQLAKIVRPKAY